MCAEVVPWRCHRSLIADALAVRGIAVEHIFSASRTQKHSLRPWARVQGTQLTYPAYAQNEAAIREDVDRSLQLPSGRRAGRSHPGRRAK
jgi:hypothetical protein